jgi:hypothetical protein
VSGTADPDGQSADDADRSVFDIGTVEGDAVAGDKITIRHDSRGAAVGDRSVVVHGDNSGVVSTSDNAVNAVYTELPPRTSGA